MMTQDDYKLWTGEDISIDSADFTRVVRVASARLASFLCLKKFPTCPDVQTDELQMLLANFICAMLKFRGNQGGQISSKTVRNFTISFKTDSAANAFAQVASNYRDIVERYSNCGDGIDAEQTDYGRF